MKHLKTTFFSILFLFACLSPFTFTALAQGNSAADSISGDIVNQNKAFTTAAGINRSMDIAQIISIIIESLLGLLGAIFIVLLLYAGFQWMTAEGNEEKVEKAKATITRAIIGLAIVIAAYSITYFVFNALNSATQGGGGGGGAGINAPG